MFLASWGKKMAELLGTLSYVIQEPLVWAAPEEAGGFPNAWWKSRNHRIVLSLLQVKKIKTYRFAGLLTQESTDTEFHPTELLLAKPTFRSHTLLLAQRDSEELQGG